MEWSDIKDAPPRLRSGKQTFTVTSVREYQNGLGHQCVDLRLQSDKGGSLTQSYSVEWEHRGYVDGFLRIFLNMSYAEVVQGAGWQSLMGREFEADMDFLDGITPNLQPVW